MRCTLDFLRFDFADPESFALGADGLLTTELALMERYVGDPNAYWCAAQQRPELLCLDIASPTTLGSSLTAPNVTTDVANSMNVYYVHETANVTSTALFGSADECHGRLVGDGVIDVFDVATLLAYLFQDVPYATLPEPYRVFTVDAREGSTTLCDSGTTQLSYAQQYDQDTCVASEPQGYTLPDRSDDVRDASPLLRRVLAIEVAPCCEETRLCLYTNDSVTMLAVATSCPSCVALVGETTTATLHRAPQGVLVTRASGAEEETPPLAPFRRDDACERQLVLGGTDATVDLLRSRAYGPGNRPYTLVRADTVATVVARASAWTAPTGWTPFPLPGRPLRVKVWLSDPTLAVGRLFRDGAPNEEGPVRLTFHCTEPPCPRQCNVVQLRAREGTLEFSQFWDACRTTLYLSDALSVKYATIVTKHDAPPVLLPAPPSPVAPPSAPPSPLTPPSSTPRNWWGLWWIPVSAVATIATVVILVHRRARAAVPQASTTPPSSTKPPATASTTHERTRQRTLYI